MKILGIDSSGLVAGTALLVDDVLVGEYTIHNKKTHSQTLLPMVTDLLEMAGIQVEELDAIAVARGPGSFTGLRIGAATAKGLAWTLGIPIVPVSTLVGLACHVREDGLVCPIMDARRGQVYTALYQVKEGEYIPLLEEAAMDIQDLFQKLEEQGFREPITFVGDGVPVFFDTIKENLKIPSRFLPAFSNYQRPALIAYLGSRYLKEGNVVKAAGFLPIYLRKSQAEREAEEAKKREEDHKC